MHHVELLPQTSFNLGAYMPIICSVQLPPVLGAKVLYHTIIPIVGTSATAERGLKCQKKLVEVMDYTAPRAADGEQE
ncbi:hypothetical protein CY34DRAFT_806537 [Suillus luteus UH-Slu-Lm8-n1]|uniref:Uncharacterized protein n=1 Tax=Suillus luteus UH-Slu-Lm8-n1 TaxID=930992 RepID=A0A0D0B3K3_9AGAM|nr:hypothetical protein CY34DRAFT_806537 [Suillus luteus UH-Slu-Lm8-n1]